MSDSLPSIKITVDPQRVFSLADVSPQRRGGVRIRTTIYVVEQYDLVTEPKITILTAPLHGEVEIRLLVPVEAEVKS